VLLVDETSLRRRHRYVTVVSDGVTGAVLGMVRHRDANALASFFVSQGYRWCRRGRWWSPTAPSRTRWRSKAPGTRPPTSWIASTWPAGSPKGLIEVRRRIPRREPPGVTPAFDPSVFRARFLALKRADRLDDAEHERLKEIFAVNADLARGWAMLPQLYGLYHAETEAETMQAVDGFADRYANDPLPEFYKLADTLLRWAPEIFAYHRAGRVSNGRLEGINNKLGVPKRIAYGFVNADNFAARGLLLCPGAGT
jgi:transposase